MCKQFVLFLGFQLKYKCLSISWYYKCLYFLPSPFVVLLMQPERLLWIESTDLVSDDFLRFISSWSLRCIIYQSGYLSYGFSTAFNRQIGNVYVRQGVFVLSSFARSKVAELEPPHIFFIVVFWVVMLILQHWALLFLQWSAYMPSSFWVIIQFFWSTATLMCGGEGPWSTTWRCFASFCSLLKAQHF